MQSTESTVRSYREAAVAHGLDALLQRHDTRAVRLPLRERAVGVAEHHKLGARAGVADLLPGRSSRLIALTALLPRITGTS